MPKNPPSEDELRELARAHVAFEVFALIDSLGEGKAGEATRARDISPHPVGHLASDHDLLVHTRVLANFLKCASGCTHSKHQRDVEAGHYNHLWGGRDVLGRDLAHIDKALSHLSRDRLTVGRDPRAKRPHLAEEVLRGLLDFIESLSDDRRKWFADCELAIRDVLGKR